MPETRILGPCAPRRVGRDAREETEDLAFLGREFLSWLLWRVARNEAVFGGGADSFGFGFGGRVRWKGLVGDVTDAVLKGPSPACSAPALAAMGSGRTLCEADLRVTRKDREWRLTLLAETLDPRGVRLPALLAEEDDDRFLERLSLLDELEAMVKLAFTEFVRERTRPAWQRSVVPAMQTWLSEGLAAD